MKYMPELTDKQLPDSKYFYTVSDMDVLIFAIGSFNINASLVHLDNRALVKIENRHCDLF